MTENNAIILNIIIPSYNRPVQILETLKQLLPQITSSAQIIVIDNFSAENYKEYCLKNRPEWHSYIENGSLKIIRNKYNIGMSANIMRAFEYCDSEWMWLVADDDRIHENAIQRILDEIRVVQRKMDVSLIKFSVDGCKVSEGQYIKTLPELIDRLSHSSAYFNSYIFITNNVYRVANFKDQIKIGCQFANTFVPHLIMLLYHLNENQNKSVVYLSTQQVAYYVRAEVGYSYGFICGLGVGAFKNFPFKLSQYDYKRLENVFAAHQDYKVIIDLFYYCFLYSNMSTARRLSQQYYIQIKGSRKPFERVALKLFSVFLYAPKIFDKLLGCLPLLSKNYGWHISEIKQRYIKPNIT